MSSDLVVTPACEPSIPLRPVPPSSHLLFKPRSSEVEMMLRFTRTEEFTAGWESGSLAFLQPLRLSALSSGSHATCENAVTKFS